ncbi:putative quinol monooxygenase [Campylobacter fetus]|uniref:putative quinol monooxygenase n=1 Tax=Campylobacter fetus TaxID=196 RepID=UPI000FCA95DC|nr:putative quinol monooxygenase [Campylobacter fetus]RUT48943.1 hypothetical protein BWK67_08685 [Campylobacter fetus]RUT49144.1 hypothetical protein BWK51_08660 [Campylobacter fetus]
MKQIIILAVGICIGVLLSLIYANKSKNIDKSSLSVRSAYIEIMPEKLDEFLQSVKTGMKTSVQSEDGVLALYAVSDKNDPTKITFFEIYKDEAAYASHIGSEHFKRYISQTKDLVTTKVLSQVEAVELQAKGIKFE